LKFLDHWLDKEAEDQYNRLAHLLGVMWTRKDFENKGGGSISVMPDEIMLPLAGIINPDVYDAVEKMFKNSPKQEADMPPELRGEQVGELGDMDPDSFRKMIGLADEMVKGGN
jgi:hypothetical protein